ncbi:hypothetical protein NPIL_31001 [Nephila pilipes]|uniref:Uncharacterized protein n=1 Tax=Nephila pilipes TaxID=299642 RepID=A0A8X6J3M4_NEPPI|nr:hypothetical protein NPIL_31001 [Nephila pilipes]
MVKGSTLLNKFSLVNSCSLANPYSLESRDMSAYLHRVNTVEELRRRMPTYYTTFVVGFITLNGLIFFFSHYWSDKLCIHYYGCTCEHHSYFGWTFLPTLIGGATM